MQITYSVIVAVVTLIAGAITKAVVDTVPDRYIPIQNLVIGLVAGAVCYYFKIEENALQAFVLCILASMGAGGAYDLYQTKIKEEE